MTDAATLSTSDRLDEATTAAVRAVADAAAAVDGTPPLSAQVLLHLRNGAVGVRHVVATGPDGNPVGYAQLDGSGGDGSVGELVVHPDERRRGVGSALVRSAIEAAASPLRVWAHGEHPGAEPLAQANGFSRSRVLWQMHLDLEGTTLPPAVFPDGVRIRPFERGRDEAEFLRVNNAAFDWHPEQGGWDTRHVDERAAEEWFDPAGFLLAVEGEGPGDGTAERLLGYHWTKVHPAGPAGPAIGEVYVLGVDPAAQGRRLGSALTIAGLEYLRSRGLDAVMLYVEADNSAAVQVYRKLGFTLWHSDVMYLR